MKKLQTSLLMIVLSTNVLFAGDFSALTRTEEVKLRMASYNVYYSSCFPSDDDPTDSGNSTDRMENFSRIINAMDADILSLQEVFHADKYFLLKTDESIKAFVEQETGESWYMASDYEFDPALDPGDGSTGKGGRFIFSRYPIIWSDFFNNRITAALVDLPASVSDKNVLVVDVHYSADVQADGTAAFVQDVIAGNKEPDIPRDVMIMVNGDFNSKPENYRFQTVYNCISDWDDFEMTHLGWNEPNITSIGRVAFDNNSNPVEVYNKFDDEAGEYTYKRIDYMLWRSDRLQKKHAYFLNPLIMDQAALDSYGLEQVDTALIPQNGITSVVGCDHWPYFADLIEGGAVANRAPTFTSIPLETGMQNVAYKYTATAFDPDGDTLTFSATNKPAWLNFDADTRTLSGTPTNTGTFSVTLRITDGEFNVDQSFTITVQPPLGAGTLLQHLDATLSASVTGSPVTQWADQSGNANHAVAADGSVLYPSSSLAPTGLAGLDFGVTANTLRLFTAAESDAWLNFTGAASGNSGFAVVMAFKVDSFPLTNSDLLGNDTSVSDGFNLRFRSNGDFKAWLDSVSVTSATTAGIGDTVVMAFNYNALSGQMELWNSDTETIDTAMAVPADFSNGNDIKLGYTSSATRFLDGMVGAVKIFDSALTASEFRSERDAMVATWVTGGGGDVAPVFTSPPITSAMENVPYSYTVTAMDLNGDSLTYSAPGLSSSWLSFDSGTQILSGTPLTGDVGMQPVTLQVTDGTNTTDQIFSILVSETPVAGNLIENPSFETGDTTSWAAPAEATVSSDTASHETYALKLSHTNNIAVTRQIIALQENIDYTFTVDMNYPVTGTSGAVTARLNVGGVKLKATVGQPTDGWEPKKIQFDSGANTSVILDIYCDTVFNGTVYVDNLVLTADDAPELTGYEIWAAAHNIGVADADADLDGLGNLLEYALNGNPTNRLDTIPSNLFKEGGQLTYRFDRRNDDPNLMVVIQARSNLTSGAWADVTLDGVTNSTNGIYDKVMYTLPTIASQSYVRLLIEYP